MSGEDVVHVAPVPQPVVAETDAFPQPVAKVHPSWHIFFAVCVANRSAWCSFTVIIPCLQRPRCDPGGSTGTMGPPFLPGPPLHRSLLDKKNPDPLHRRIDSALVGSRILHLHAASSMYIQCAAHHCMSCAGQLVDALRMLAAKHQMCVPSKHVTCTLPVPCGCFSPCKHIQ